MSKVNTDKVITSWARQAIARAQDINSAYSAYIRASYQATGSLDCGCNAKDLIAWYAKFMPVEYAAKGGK